MRCSGSPHPSSLLVEGAGRARVSVPPAPWCHALVTIGVVRDNMQFHALISCILCIYSLKYNHKCMLSLFKMIKLKNFIF